MRTVTGAAALAAGIVISLVTALLASGHPDAAWLLWLAGTFVLALLVAGFFLLWRRRAEPPRRWLVVSGAFAGGLIGFVIALVTTSSGIYARGTEFVDGKPVQSYEFIVSVFGQVIHEEIGPAVERPGRDGTHTGPEDKLNTAMVAVGWSLVAAYVLIFSVVGAGAGAGIRRLTRAAGQRCASGIQVE